MALFITFEGGEGCGKSTQARLLYRRLRQLVLPAVLTREPGGTRLGDRARRWLKHSADPISPETELLLFCACRAQLVRQVIRPALERGDIVLCDRFADSTVAYQGYGRGLDLTAIEEANYIATGDTLPHLTILLDIPVKEGLARKENSGIDRFEKETTRFHERVRQGYAELVSGEPSRWLVVDARQDKAAVAAAIWQRVAVLIAGQAGIGG